MLKLVTLQIDDRELTVPEGTLIVNAAREAGIIIPVFCFHPKLKPVGMCRMCLVEIGRPAVDRATGETLREVDGSPKIQFGPKLETACTTPVSEGMRVVTTSPKVQASRRDIIEFILTSHPLDCPVCDKGGECPLQNLTLAHGSFESRFRFDEKMHLAKMVPLGDLISLDRERCIQCARCIRFQTEVADDPVIGFFQRGRSLEIVTFSEPGFDSIFSGNTTDICPVGALTTRDFRFGARPWEMNEAASICPLCPVGCNLTLNVRTEARSDGAKVIKRVMPRENPFVNEIWICDKGRFGHHFAESGNRLTQPLMRKDGELAPVDWEEALETAALKIRGVVQNMVTVVGGGLSNEDLFNIRQLTASKCAEPNLYDWMAGGDLTVKVGLGSSSNLASLGKGDAILVVACDLHEEAPLWWLRVRQAAERGAALIVANPRPTRLDKFASHLLQYNPGGESAFIASLLPNKKEKPSEIAKVFADAANAVVIYGSEGVGLQGSFKLANTCAELLLQSGHYGKPNNGLVAAFRNGNTQGAWDMGFRPALDLKERIARAGLLFIAGADPAGDDPELARAVDLADFVIVQELFLTETAKRADIVFPAQAFVEREGTYTNGERRVQRFYQAIPPLTGARADFTIAAQIARHAGVELEVDSAAVIMSEIAGLVPSYAGISYQTLAESAEPGAITRVDLFFYGTSYKNRQGIGIQLPTTSEKGEKVQLEKVKAYQLKTAAKNELLVLPITTLLDQGSLIADNPTLEKRLASAVLRLHPRMASRYGFGQGSKAALLIDGLTYPITVELDEGLPDKAAFLPRSVGIPLREPAGVQLVPVEEMALVR
jgi:NADH-quinone oxidoreductase subunit G